MNKRKSVGGVGVNGDGERKKEIKEDPSLLIVRSTHSPNELKLKSINERALKYKLHYDNTLKVLVIIKFLMQAFN